MWSDATDGRREAREWAGYHHVNQQFADVVIENYQKDDIGKLTILSYATVNRSSGVCSCAGSNQITKLMCSCSLDTRLSLTTSSWYDQRAYPRCQNRAFCSCPFPKFRDFQMLAKYVNQGVKDE